MLAFELIGSPQPKNGRGGNNQQSNTVVGVCDDDATVSSQIRRGDSAHETDGFRISRARERALIFAANFGLPDVTVHTFRASTLDPILIKSAKPFTHDANGAIFKAMVLETQKPAPPVANQK